MDDSLFLDLNGGTAHVVVRDDAGDGRAAARDGAATPAVVLLHYFGGSAQSWREVVDALGASGTGVRCIAPDLRGFGDSAASAPSGGDPPGAGYAVNDYADDVAALVGALGLGDYVLVGHSMGGKVAAALAARRPAGLRGLLLVAPSPPWPEPMDDAERARLLHTHGDRAAAADTVRRTTTLPLPPALFERAVDDRVRSSAAAWRAWLAHGSREDLSGRVGRLDDGGRLPVHVLVGRRDPVMARALMAQVADHLGGMLRVASDAGHLLPLESPHTVADAIRALLGGLAGARGAVCTPDARYPDGTARALLATDLVTPATRRVLGDRLAARDQRPAPRFFDAHEFRTLVAVCECLIPQGGCPHPAHLPGAVDERLADGKGDGWRYATMPPDPVAYRLGLRGIDEQAQAAHGLTFAALDGAGQDAVLAALQAGAVTGGAWDVLPAERFFEELLAELVEAYYSHPAAQDEIGYVGYADAHGWQAIGLDERAPHEPRPVPAAPPVAALGDASVSAAADAPVEAGA